MTEDDLVDYTVTHTGYEVPVFVWENGEMHTITYKQAAIDDIKSQPFY